MIPLLDLAYPVALGLMLALSIGLLLRMMRLQSQVAQARLELVGANNRLLHAQEQAALLANTDAVTGLLVRQVVVERFQLSLSIARRHDAMFGIVLIQLPSFDYLVDQYGVDVTNRLLAAFATRLRNATRDTDSIGRVREYEFAVLLPVLAGSEDLAAVVTKLKSAMEPSYTLPGEPEPFRIAMYFGSACFPRDGADWSTILKAADDSLSRGRMQIRPVPAAA